MTTDDEAIVMIEARLSELTDVDRELRELQSEVDKAVRAIIAASAPSVDSLTERREKLLEGISSLFQEHQAALTGDGKIVVFRSGTLQARLSPGKLVVEDEKRAIAFIKRMGKLRIFTRIGKRSLDKDALKANPVFALRVPGITIEKDELLTIKLPKTRTEIVRKLHPLRIRLN